MNFVNFRLKIHPKAVHASDHLYREPIISGFEILAILRNFLIRGQDRYRHAVFSEARVSVFFISLNKISDPKRIFSL